MLHARKPSGVGARRGWLLSVAASAIVLGASPVYAQAQAEGTDVDEVVVTGVRASMRSAQTIKKNSDLVVDSIVAEDVGKLPDNNVAVALARVSVVQVRRDAQRRIYELNREGVGELAEWVHRLQGFWTTRLDVLESVITNDPRRHKR